MQDNKITDTKKAEATELAKKQAAEKEAAEKEAAEKEAAEKAEAEKIAEEAKVAEEKAKQEAEELAQKEAAEKAEAEKKAKGVTFEKPVEEEVTAYGVYNTRGNLVKMYRKGPHGDNFAELAKNYAERMGDGLVAKPYVPPVIVEETDTNTVHIVTSNDQPVRTFSLVVHGENYEQLAQNFIQKQGKKKGYRIK